MKISISTKAHSQGCRCPPEHTKTCTQERCPRRASDNQFFAELEARNKKSTSREQSVEKTITLTGSPDAVNRVLAFLGMLQFNGNVGHSGMFALGWDGDGADQLQVSGIEDVAKQCRDGYNACTSYGADLEYMGSFGSFGVCKTSDQKLLWTLREGDVSEKESK